MNGIRAPFPGAAVQTVAPPIVWQAVVTRWRIYLDWACWPVAKGMQTAAQWRVDKDWLVGHWQKARRMQHSEGSTKTGLSVTGKRYAECTTVKGPQRLACRSLAKGVQNAAQWRVHKDWLVGHWQKVFRTQHNGGSTKTGLSVTGEMHAL